MFYLCLSTVFHLIAIFLLVKVKNDNNSGISFYQKRTTASKPLVLVAFVGHVCIVSDFYQVNPKHDNSNKLHGKLLTNNRLTKRKAFVETYVAAQNAKRKQLTNQSTV